MELDERTEKLAAVKAFRLGARIAKDAISASRASDVVSKAIQRLDGKADDTSQFRLAFYLLLRASIHRADSQAAVDREKAQKVCEATRSALFKHYMSVAEASTGKARLDGISSLTIREPQPSEPKTVVQGEGWHTWTETVDPGLEVLGLRFDHLRESERRFLMETTLKDLLSKHQLL